MTTYPFRNTCNVTMNECDGNKLVFYHLCTWIWTFRVSLTVLWQYCLIDRDIIIKVLMLMDYKQSLMVKKTKWNTDHYKKMFSPTVGITVSAAVLTNSSWTLWSRRSYFCLNILSPADACMTVAGKKRSSGTTNSCLTEAAVIVSRNVLRQWNYKILAVRWPVAWAPAYS